MQPTTWCLAPCTHEEAATRMFLHAADAVNQGHQRIILRTVDSDVLALATAMVQQLQQVSQNSSLVEKAELSRLSPIHRQHYCSTPRELFTRQAIAGDKLLVRPHLPSPTEWGWVFGANGWQPFWTNLPEVTASCRELVKCRCTKT